MLLSTFHRECYSICILHTSRGLRPVSFTDSSDSDTHVTEAARYSLCRALRNRPIKKPLMGFSGLCLRNGACPCHPVQEITVSDRFNQPLKRWSLNVENRTPASPPGTGPASCRATSHLRSFGRWGGENRVKNRISSCYARHGLLQKLRSQDLA